MRLESCDVVWSEIREDLCSRIGKDRYERWLAPLTLAWREGELRLGVPNLFWLEWIEKRYLKAVADTIAEKSGKRVRVTVAIDPELFQGMRNDQQAILGDVRRDPPCGDEPAPAIVPAPRQHAGGTSPSAIHSHGSPQTFRPAEAQTFDTFVVGSSNRMAYQSALQVVQYPGNLYNPLLVHGACGVGKTHLLRAICHALRAWGTGLQVRYLTGEEFLNQFVTSLRSGVIAGFRQRYRSPQVLVVDDIHLLGNKAKTQEEFLHTFNALCDEGHQIVLASDTHPKAIANLRESLLVRFISGLVVEVCRPDFETRLEILRRMAAGSRIPFRPEVLEFLASKIRSNIRELIGGMNLLKAKSIEEDKPLEQAQAERFLMDSLRIEEKPVSLPRIADRVARHFAVTAEALTSSSRRRSLTLARQVAMTLSRKYTGRSLAEIGMFFGGRNHTSVKSAEGKVERLRQRDPALAKQIEKIADSLEE